MTGGRVSYESQFHSKGIIYEAPPTQQVENYLAYKMPEASQVKVVKFERSFPGFSRETWFITAEVTREGRCQTIRYVLCTKPISGGLRWMPLAHEAEVLKRLEGTGVPIARVLWHETDPQWLLNDREFFIREWVDGILIPPGLHDPDKKYNALRERVVKELMEKIALVHSLDWEALGFGEFIDVPKNPQHAAIEYIDWAIDHMKEVPIKPLPEVTEALLWLRHNPPPPPSRICLRKENLGIGEEVWRDDKIVAMCDWESASIGDPALDLFWAMVTTGHLWDKDKALAYYEEYSGYRIERASLEYYENLRAIRGFTALHGGLYSFITGADKRIQLASLGVFNTTRRNSIARAAGF